MQSIATLFGTDLTTIAIVLSLVITSVAILVVIIAAKDKAVLPSGALSFFLTVLFTVIGWYPAFLGAAMAIAVAVIFAFYVASTTRGGSS
jgi:hypothetical protein